MKKERNTNFILCSKRNVPKTEKKMLAQSDS